MADNNNSIDENASQNDDDVIISSQEAVTAYISELGYLVLRTDDAEILISPHNVMVFAKAISNIIDGFDFS